MAILIVNFREAGQRMGIAIRRQLAVQSNFSLRVSLDQGANAAFLDLDYPSSQPSCYY